MLYSIFLVFYTTNMLNLSMLRNTKRYFVMFRKSVSKLFYLHISEKKCNFAADLKGIP